MTKQETGNPKDLAAGGTRVDISVFPMTAIVYGALAMTEGHLKYGGFNYRVTDIRASVYISAFLRHFFKWINGEWSDPITNVPHLANCLACISLLIDAVECGKLIDDRPPKVPDIAELFAWAEEVTEHLHKIYPPENGPGRFTEEGQREKQTINLTGPVHVGVSSWGLFPNRSGD